MKEDNFKKLLLMINPNIDKLSVMEGHKLCKEVLCLIKEDFIHRDEVKEVITRLFPIIKKHPDRVPGKWNDLMRIKLLKELGFWWKR